jgi:hypothetical protein
VLASPYAALMQGRQREIVLSSAALQGPGRSDLTYSALDSPMADVTHSKAAGHAMRRMRRVGQKTPERDGFTNTLVA